MGDMDAAFRVFTSTGSDDARNLVYDIKEHHAISRDDPIWAALLAIDYRMALVAAIPPERDNTAKHFVETLNAVLHEFGTRYTAIEGETQLGADSAHFDIQEHKEPKDRICHYPAIFLSPSPCPRMALNPKALKRRQITPTSLIQLQALG